MAVDFRNDFVVSPLDIAYTSVSITGATVVSTTIAAPANSLNRNCVKRLTATAAASGAQAALVVGVFDGASTSSTPLALYALGVALIAASTGVPTPPLDLDNLHILASANKATCIGTTAAPAASTTVAITIQSYVFGKQPTTYNFNS